MRLESSCSCSEAPAGRKALLKQRKDNLAPIPSVFHVFCTKHRPRSPVHLSHFFYSHLSTTLCLFVLPCSHGNVFCESTLQLIFQCPPTPTPAWKMDLGWLILTLLDSRRQAVRNEERETNVGQHWGVSQCRVYIVLFSQSCELLVFCERNRIPTNETSHCSCSQAPRGPLPMHFLYLSTPLRPAQLNNLQHPQFLRISPEAF